MPFAVVESSESVAVTCITDEPVETKLDKKIRRGEGQSGNQTLHITSHGARGG